MAVKILGEEFECEAISRPLTVPDCNVVLPNKIGTGHGESKYYFGSKPEMENFFGSADPVRCFFLRSDLVTYMGAIRKEYERPSQYYTGINAFPSLWATRNAKVQASSDLIPFSVQLQRQIAGPRGYLNSDDDAYKLFRELSLPLTSYITIMRLRNASRGVVFYWKLFVDFDAIGERQPLVLTYGMRAKHGALPPPSPPVVRQRANQRDGQQTYREQLLQDNPFCPITMITDDRLLIASHIKPFAVCNADEEYDRHNGYMLSPLYDRLFDQGFLSFTNDRKMKVSMWLNSRTQRQCGIAEGKFVQMLPMDDARAAYLDYHRQFVFKG